MMISWTDFKTFITQRSSSIHYANVSNCYWIHTYDQPFSVECLIPTDGSAAADVTDFETNFKPNANRPVSATVTTQYELNDKTLKLACISAPFDVVTNIASIQLKVPGTFTGIDPMTCDGRFVAGGYAFSDGYKFGDMLTKIEVIDIDNLLGYGANTVIKTYSDQDVDAANCGWYLYASHQNQGEVEIDPIGGYGFLPAGMYLHIVFKRAAGSLATAVAVDIWWGKKE